MVLYVVNFIRREAIFFFERILNLFTSKTFVQANVIFYLQKGQSFWILEWNLKETEVYLLPNQIAMAFSCLLPTVLLKDDILFRTNLSR